MKVVERVDEGFLVVFVKEFFVVLVPEGGAQFVDAASLDLSYAFASEVEEISDVFEGDAAAVGDVEGAGFGHFPDFEVGEVHFDGAGLRDDVEVEVVFARDPRTWTWGGAAVAAGARSELFKSLKDFLGFFDFVGGEESDLEGFGASQAASRAACCGGGSHGTIAGVGATRHGIGLVGGFVRCARRV